MGETIQYPRLRWFVLLTVSLGYIAFSANLIAISPLLAEIAKDLQIDMGTATNLMTVAVLFSSFGTIVGGFLCDRFGIMFVVILGHVCAAISAALIPWIGTSYKAMLWIRIFQGVSGGSLMCLMSQIVGMWFPKREGGLASGLMSGTIPLGSAIGVLAAPALFLLLKSWQQMAACFSIISWIGLVVALVIVLSPKPKLPSQAGSIERQAPDGRAFKRALSSPITWIGIFTVFFAQWCLQTIYGIVPSYLAADKPIGVGFGPMMSGKLMMAVMIAGMIGPVIGGLLQDKAFRGNPKPVMLIGFILCIFISAIAFPFVQANLFSIVISLILAGAGIVFIFPGIIIYISKAYPMHIAGKILGLWFGLGAFGGAAGLFAVGLIVAKFGSYKFAILQIALVALFGFILVLFLAKPKQQESSLKA